MKTINWGIIGCGDVCEKKSGPAFNQINNSRLTGVMRRNGQLAQEYAKRHNVHFWTNSSKELIYHPEINAIYIATPPGSHLELALEVCRAGKPVYVEKPMARNHRECAEMIDAFSKAQIPLFIAYYKRSLERFNKVKDLIETYEIGEVKKVSYHFFQPFHKHFQKNIKKENIPWRLQAQSSGGGLFLDVGCHALDIMDYFFGALLEVKGHAKNQKSLYEVEDLVEMSFKTFNGAQGSASWNFSSSLTKDLMTISGSKGKIELSIFGNEPILLKKNNFFSKSTLFPIKNPSPIQKPMIESIVNQLTGKGTCPSTAESAARTSKVMDLVLQNYYGNRDENFWEKPKSWPGKR
jgi:1,5-anhydro-D-fructose reductase (1,5-anhydro-D-mannitol-forming)